MNSMGPWGHCILQCIPTCHGILGDSIFLKCVGTCGILGTLGSGTLRTLDPEIPYLAHGILGNSRILECIPDVATSGNLGSVQCGILDMGPWEPIDPTNVYCDVGTLGNPWMYECAYLMRDLEDRMDLDFLPWHMSACYNV